MSSEIFVDLYCNRYPTLSAGTEIRGAVQLNNIIYVNRTAQRA